MVSILWMLPVIKRDSCRSFTLWLKNNFEIDHVELVPAEDLKKRPHEMFYLPVHAARKESSSTTKIRAVFNTSAKSSGVSLNDTLMVGPTVHSSLIDVMLQFCLALTTDVSQIYWWVWLADTDKDFHRFIWRKTTSEPLHDYRSKSHIRCLVCSKHGS